MALVIPRSKALLAASKKLKFKSDKAIEETCEFAGMGAADAYRCGAEEAQNEIVQRLQALTVYSASTHPTKEALSVTFPKAPVPQTEKDRG
jgi:hypothetical protein